MIILYDIPSPWPNKAWSPNTWKTRYVLNYKKIPYRTEWVEYPDIEAHCKSIGALPTGTKEGSPFYTLPVIKDLSTGKVVSDSFEITKYLDEAYPDSVPMLPKDTVALQRVFQHAFRGQLHHLWDCIVPCARLNPRSHAYFVETRQRWWGVPFDQIAPKGNEAVERWRKIEQDFAVVDQWYGQNRWIMGDQITFGDVAVVAPMAWIRLTLRDKWDEQVSQWHGGRWKRMVQEFEEYSAVD